jgi:hypothetical protein
LVGWLYVSARLAAAKAMCSERRRLVREQEVHIMNELLSDDAAPAVDWDQVRPVLDDAMSQLSTRDREVVLLRFFAQHPFAEIGARCGLSEDAARMRVERALGKLHDLLARRGITSTTAALGMALANQAVTAAPAGLAVQVTGAALVQAAAAGGTAATVAGIFQFMSTTKSVIGIAAIVGVLSIGTVVHEISQAQAAESTASAIQAENRTLVARWQELQHAAETAELAVQKGATDARAHTTNTKSPAAAMDAAIIDDQEAAKARGREFLAAHPEFRPLLIAEQRLRYADDYAAFYRKIGLTPDQIERFEAVLLESSYPSYVNASGQRVVFNYAPRQYSAAEQAMQLREVLGEANYAEYQEYTRTSEARRKTDALARSLYYTDSALTAEQAGQMEQILMQSSADYRAGRFMRSRSIDWAYVMAQVPGVLSARQMEAMNSLRTRAQWLEALNQAQNASLVASQRASSVP